MNVRSETGLLGKVQEFGFEDAGCRSPDGLSKFRSDALEDCDRGDDRVDGLWVVGG